MSNHFAPSPAQRASYAPESGAGSSQHLHVVPTSSTSHQQKAAEPPILSVSHLEKIYGGRGNITHALTDVSFNVCRGEFIAIMGASGSGKSTLLNCISTIDTATSGHVWLNGADVTALKSRQLARFRREQLGFVFQDSNLLDTLTARENIALPLTIGHVPAAQCLERVNAVARRLNIENTLDESPLSVIRWTTATCFGGACSCYRPCHNYGRRANGSSGLEKRSLALGVLRNAQHAR